MQKILTLYRHDYDNGGLVRDEVEEGARWVPAGQGQASIKHDGTCCLVTSGRLYKRFHCREGRALPDGFLQVQRVDQKDHRGKRVIKLYGWLPVSDTPGDVYHREAWENCTDLPAGTYELIGPRIQGNPYGLAKHILVRHGLCRISAPTSYNGLRAFLMKHKIEGIVFRHEDGRMTKIKRRDFGLPWPC